MSFFRQFAEVELSEKHIAFTRGLLRWNKNSNKREMPWKGEKNPYRIWLSEIILQQTRVEQGRQYYENFIKTFPTIQQLAKAPLSRVMKLWEGLGYYSRCRNLHETARLVVKNHNGVFPKTWEELLKLKGVGPYTAAAIASFAYNLPHAVVDGNVYRILARYFGIDTPIDTVSGKLRFNKLAAELLDTKQAGNYNQAIMDFGATVCRPLNPDCRNCPLQKNCQAYWEQKVSFYPVKSKTLVKKNRWFYYLILRRGDSVYIRRRTGNDIWQGLYEFYLLEKPGHVPVKKIVEEVQAMPLFGKASVASVSAEFCQQLTHQTIRGQFIEITLGKSPALKGWEAVLLKKISNFPFPKFIHSYLETKFE